jgi:serine/threonine protein kinase
VEIAKGSFKKIHQATDTVTGKDVALGVFADGLPKSALPFGELVALATNDHPATLKLVAFSFDGSSAVPTQVATELIPNATRGDIAVLNATAKSKLIFGIVSGMASLHARGFLHRDLKPSNVLLNEQLEPIIADFDLSRPYAAGVNLAIKTGTPLFMTPERVGDDGATYDFAADVFSFAVTLHQLLTKSEKYDDGKGRPKHTRGLFERVSAGARLVRTPEIPDYHWGVIVRCWKQNAKERPTFQELLDEFHGSHEYILPDADRSAVLEYEGRVGTSFGAPNSRDLNASASQE